MSKQLRQLPPIGTVIGIPLKGGAYAHAVQANGNQWWVYNLLTDSLAADPDLFPPSKWMKLYYTRGEGVGSKTVDELKIILPHEVAESSPTYTVKPE